MGLTTNSVVYAQDFRDISSTRQLPLGTRGETRDGRKYRYALAGATALDPGKLAVNADLVSNHTNIVVAAAVSVGATKVTATLGATAATANQYQDGYLVVNDAAGEGINYLINGHAAVLSAGVITVNLVDQVEVALTTSSEVTLKANPYSGIVVSATDQADQPVGVPNVTITAAYYGWVQTGGECSVLADEAVTKGLALTIGTGVAGAVEALDAAGEFQIGVASEALVDTEYRSAYLTIDA
jgi:hypothetical protein